MKKAMNKSLKVFISLVFILLQLTQPLTQVASDTLVSTDLATVLPDSSNGSIISSFDASFTDDTGLAVDPSQLTLKTNVKLHYQWSIPNELKDGYEIKAGDTFSFNLPTQITVSAGSGSLGQYGTYKIAATGLVTFTFNSEVENDSNVSGDFYYNQGKLNVTTPGFSIISVPTINGNKDVPITVEPSGGTDISKSGQLDTAKNGQKITWTVDVNSSQKTLKNASITETMPNGVTLTSTKVQLLNVAMDGTISGVGSDLISGTDYTVDASGNISFIGAYAETRKAFRITYVTDIDKSSIPTEGGTLDFKNQATLNNQGTTSPAEATVSSTYDKLISKSATTAGGNEQVKWTVNFNPGRLTLAASDAVITDSLDANSSYVTDSIVVKNSAGKVLVKDQDYVLSFDQNNHMTLAFPSGLSTGVVLTYKTQYNGSLSRNGATVTNEASAAGATTGKISYTLKTTGSTKSISNIDYMNDLVGWNIVINQDRQTMKNVSILDKMGLGLHLNENSMVVTDLDLNSVLDPSKYNIDKTAATSTEGERFVLSFNGSQMTEAELSHAYQIHYTTNIDYASMQDGKVTNRSEFTWTDPINQVRTEGFNAPFDPVTAIDNDGAKSGSYNAVSKEISWTVGVNYQTNLLKAPVITDTISSDQAYIADSAAVYKVTAISTNGTPTLETQATAASISFDEQTKTLKVVLPDGSDAPYVLKYKTKPVGITQASYSNTATLTTADDSENFTAKVSITNGNNHLTKTGEQSKTDSSYVDWKLTMNASQSIVENASILDTPSANQIISYSSFKIQEAAVNTDGSLSGAYAKDSSPLVLDQDYTITKNTDGSFVIRFLKTLEHAYYITYSALIDSEQTKDTVSNSADLVSNDTTPISGSQTSQVNVVNNGGSSVGSKYKLILNKVDSDTKEQLSGASFVLTKKNSSFSQTKTTDTNGQINFTDLKAGTYTLTETVAPVGYVLPTESYTIVIDNDTTVDKIITYTVSNTKIKGDVVLTKTDTETTEPLSGVTFDLYDNSDAKIASDLTTDQNGQIKVDQLVPGSYYFIETSTAFGYDFDATMHYHFEISLSELNAVISITNTKTPIVPVTPVTPATPTEPVTSEIPTLPVTPVSSQTSENTKATEKTSTPVDAKASDEKTLPQTGSDSQFFGLVVGILLLSAGILLKKMKQHS